MVRGFLCIILAMLIYGFTPVLAVLSYQGGSNGINLAFFRSIIPLPILLLLSARYPRPQRSQLKLGLLLGVFLYGFILSAYLSYSYISVGASTVIQFLYVPMVALYERLVRKQKLSSLQRIGYVLCLVGTVFFIGQDAEHFNWLGILLALLSAVMYAAYVIALDREAQNPLPMYQLTLLIVLVGAAVSLIGGLLLGQITFRMTGSAWLYTAVIALLMVLVGITLFQKGIRLVGEAQAAVLSLLQLPMGVFFGIIVLKEAFSLWTFAGCVLILLGLCLTAKQKGKG